MKFVQWSLWKTKKKLKEPKFNYMYTKYLPLILYRYINEWKKWNCFMWCVKEMGVRMANYCGWEAKFRCYTRRSSIFVNVMFYRYSVTHCSQHCWGRELYILHMGRLTLTTKSKFPTYCYDTKISRNENSLFVIWYYCCTSPTYLEFLVWI